MSTALLASSPPTAGSFLLTGSWPLSSSSSTCIAAQLVSAQPMPATRTSAAGSTAAVLGGSPALPSARPGVSSRGKLVACSATREFCAVTTGKRARRKGRKGGGGDSGSDDDWSDDMLWALDQGGFTFGGSGGPGGNGWGSGGSGGGSGGSGWNPRWGYGPGFGSGGYSEGYWANKAFYECMWFWQLVCAGSLLQALHFVLTPAGSVTKPGVVGSAPSAAVMGVAAAAAVASSAGVHVEAASS